MILSKLQEPTFKENGKYIPIVPPDLVLWLTLLSSNYPCLETYFHGFKGVWAIEVLLCFQIYYKYHAC